MKQEIDEFELAELENDERKFEAYAEDQESKICEVCKIQFEQNELDLHDGAWVCHECEEELK